MFRFVLFSLVFLSTGADAMALSDDMPKSRLHTVAPKAEPQVPPQPPERTPYPPSERERMLDDIVDLMMRGETGRAEILHREYGKKYGRTGASAPPKPKPPSQPYKSRHSPLVLPPEAR